MNILKKVQQDGVSIFLAVASLIITRSWMNHLIGEPDAADLAAIFILPFVFAFVFFGVCFAGEVVARVWPWFRKQAPSFSSRSETAFGYAAVFTVIWVVLLILLSDLLPKNTLL